MAYLNWDTKVVENLSAEEASRLYGGGYVLTRVGKGVMNRTRSFRIRLADFEPSSENRRIMRKSDHVLMEFRPLPYDGYSWEIGKLAKDFYEARGADFSANKVKELLTDPEASSFNALVIYTDSRTAKPVGYAICYEDSRVFHYSYPFYAEDPAEPSRGLGMMMKAVEYAKLRNLDYIYLGSLQRPSDTYKLQFKGGEWFDGERWRADIEPLKEILRP